MPFFANQDFPDRDFMVSIAEVVKFEEFEQNTVIMRMGDLGDKMYFSIRGRLGIFLSKEVEGDPVAVIPEFSTVGERALKNEDDRRSATVVCLDAGVTHCLSLTKKDYQRLVYVSTFISNLHCFHFNQRSHLVAKGVRFAFLVKDIDSLFANWTKAKILDLNENYIEQFQMS